MSEDLLNPETPSLPIDLRTEYLVNPLGLDEKEPRLSWRLLDARRGANQTAWEIQAASTAEGIEQPDLWESGQVKDPHSLDRIWQGKELAARQRVYWRVRVWDQHGEASPWSELASFELGLPEVDWQASWIGRHDETHYADRPCPMLRQTFELSAAPVQARLYISARGLYEAHLNGEKVGEDFLVPGWTDYAFRIEYLTYDVTALLREGANCLGALLGDGWFAGRLGWQDSYALWGKHPSLCARLEVRLEDGTDVTVVTDESWQAAPSWLIGADLYDGEKIDLTQYPQGWDLAESKSSDIPWEPVHTFEPPEAPLVAKVVLPTRQREILPAIAHTEPTPGAHIYDFGQNLVGVIHLKAKAPAGTVITVRHGEMLQQDGTLYVANLRSAKAIDTFIMGPSGEATFEPRFTFHGFRYVEITGLANEPRLEDLQAVVLHNAMEETGHFSCSHPKVTQLQSNIRWGQKGNFLEAPTDCPQRDERLGWTGDAQVFIRTACFNFDVAPFFTKWQQDLEDGQHESGVIPSVAPDIMRRRQIIEGKEVTYNGASAAWADAVVICPWTIHRCYGDTRLLERHFESMAGWVRWRAKNYPSGIDTHWGFGDWLAIDIAENSPGRAPTPRELIATAYHAQTSRIMATIAGILGKLDEQKEFRELSEHVTTAFRREFITPGGRVVGHTQTGYLLALGFDLVPEALQAAAVEHLVELIEGRGNHLSTGFVGTPLLAPVLSRFGRTDVAYKLLLQENYPSWLYTIDQGATTMWERWNSYTHKDGFGDVGMNSFNHYAYGAIGEWMYAVVAGIDLDPEVPAYRAARIAPQPANPLTWAEGRLRTRYGVLSTRWEQADDQFSLDLTIPPGTTAQVLLPPDCTGEVTEGARPLAKAEGISEIAAKNGQITFRVTAGRYRFSVTRAS